MKKIVNKILAIFIFGFIAFQLNFVYAAGVNLNLNVVNSVTAYTISSSSGAGGTISPLGDTSVNEGDSASFTMSASTGYHVSDVLVDGSTVGAQTNFTFFNVTANHTISATFAINSYTIGTTVLGGGSITPSGTIAKYFNESQSFSLVPSVGYYIENVTVDGLSYGAVSSFAFQNISSNHSISVLFGQRAFTISSSVTGSGNINLPTGSSYLYGQDITADIVPASGYYISDVLVDNGSVGPLTSYTFENINSNHTIAAVFTKSPDPKKYYDITIEKNHGGSVTPNGQISFAEGDDLIINITPDNGYRISKIYLDGNEVEAKDIAEINNISSSHTIRVVFDIVSSSITDTYNINFDYDSSQIVSPDVNSLMVKSGESQTMNFEAKEGFEIKDVIIDGESHGKISNFTFSDIKENHNVKIVSSQVQTSIVDQISDITDKVIAGTSDTIKSVAKPINDLAEKIGLDEKTTPIALSTASTAAVAVGAAAAPIANASLFGGQEFLRSLWYSIASLASRKKKKKWGNVIEYHTGVPIAQAVVRLFSLGEDWKTNPVAKKLVSTTYTDTQGSFAFVVEPGKYLLEVTKDKFKQYLVDGFYSAEPIEIKDERDSLIVPTVAMISNDEKVIKKFNRLVMATKIEKVAPYFSLACLVFSTIVTANSAVKALNSISATMLGVCILLWIVTVFNLSKKSPWGKVTEKNTNKPISLALIRFMDFADNHLIKTAVTDQTGKFQVIIPKGKYNLAVSKQGYKLTENIEIEAATNNDIVNRKIELEKIG